MSWDASIVAGLSEVSSAYTYDGYLHHYFLNSDTIFCPSRGGTRSHALSGREVSADNTYAADSLPARSSYDLVQVFTDGAQAGGGCGGGLFDCTHPPSGETSAYFDVVTVEWDPFGSDTELRAPADGSLRPILLPEGGPPGNSTPDSVGFLMRPTALEWDDQDPTNDANRTFWLPSELIGVLGAVHYYHHMVDAATYDFFLGSGVRAWNVLSGEPHEPGTEQPVICFI